VSPVEEQKKWEKEVHTPSIKRGRGNRRNRGKVGLKKKIKVTKGDHGKKEKNNVLKWGPMEERKHTFVKKYSKLKKKMQKREYARSTENKQKRSGGDTDCSAGWGEFLISEKL